MRYLAQRVGTGEWLHRDLPLYDVERTRDLSGPGTITFNVPDGMVEQWHSDGLRLLEDWGTIIYACDEDTGRIRQAGIMVPSQQYDETQQSLTAAGFAGYAHGYIRTESTTAMIQVDPLVVVREQWEWIQAQPDSDLGMAVVGDLASTVKIGNNADPYRMQWFESPDIGAEIDSLSESTPFDYTEHHAWADETQQEVLHQFVIGWPRLGRDRSDLRFALGENIIETIPIATSETYANDVVGIGNGEGSTLVWSRASVSDGRLRRTKVVTDKTIKDRDKMRKRTRDTLLRLSPTLDIAQVTIEDHPNAPLSSIELGDDIRVLTHLPTYGDVDVKVRVLSISESDDSPGTAVLGTQLSSTFVYNPWESLT